MKLSEKCALRGGRAENSVKTSNALILRGSERQEERKREKGRKERGKEEKYYSDSHINNSHLIINLESLLT